ncbi:MAG: recombinase family protein [Steroidobacteraceae bacterium]
MVPPKSKFVSYYRVSTAKQGRSGLGLESQKAAVDAYLKQHSGVELASFVEIESGKSNDRPKLTAALIRCQQTRATLLVAKLDRLSRNAAFLMNLRDSDVKFQALDIPEANTLTLGVMALLAQQERELISQRTKAALAARKARGLPMGNPRDLSAYAKRASLKGRAVITAQARERAELVKPAIEAARGQGCTSLRQIAACLNEQSITTPKGKSWTATAVRNAVAMIERSASTAAPARHK